MKNEKENKRPFIIFGSPKIEQPEIDEVIDCLNSGWLGTGPRTHLFEKMFKEFKGSQYAMAVNSCTAAMHLALIALGIGPGDEVITTAMTFCSTVNTILHVGARPVLADCEMDSMNIDPVQIEKKITKNTKALLPVHFAGRPCNMNTIMDIAKKNNLFVIEDCAHAIESEYHGNKTGTFGDIGCFSFYVTKNIITGEGGMAITNNEDYASRIKTMALHGLSRDAWKRFSDEGYKHYYVADAGFKYNMMDIQAAIGIHQLKRIESYWKRRQEIWNSYNDAFQHLPITLPSPVEENTKHAYHLFTILIDKEMTGIARDEFLNAITQHQIGVGVHYLSIPEHPYYQKTLGWRPEDYPNAMNIGRQTVSLPLSAKLTDQNVADVIEATKEIIGK